MASWYISKDRNKEGPLSEDQLVKRIKAGEFGKGALVWKKGMSTWEPLELHFDTVVEAISSHFSVPINPDANAENSILARPEEPKKNWMDQALQFLESTRI